MAEEKTSILGIKDLLAKEKEHHPCLVVISGKSAGRLFRISELGTIVIGRGAETDIRIEDDGISRRHARVVRQANGVLVIEDLGSTNGTFFNGKKEPTHVLQDGDKIQIGSTTILKFSYADNVEETYQRNLYESATRDALTGCFNKKFFVERLASEFAYAARHESELSLAMFDLDHFKRVNDTYGHPAGDAILRHFSGLVAQSIRAEDTFCRFGGEEFAVIFRETPAQEAVSISERIRATLQSKVCEHEGQAIPVTCSIGVCTMKHGSVFVGPNELLQAADELLYEAKHGGRNRVVAR